MDLESGRLFEGGRLLNFHHFQQVQYVYFATKQKIVITKGEDVTKQGSVKYSEENYIFGKVSYSFFGGWEGVEGWVGVGAY